MIDVADYRTIQSGDWLWPHFEPEELADRASFALRIDPAFMDCLERIRFVLALFSIVMLCLFKLVPWPH
jgi:hypothetical protein